MRKRQHQYAVKTREGVESGDHVLNEEADEFIIQSEIELIDDGSHMAKLNKSGICILSCGKCPAVYVGQTGRKLLTRLAEYRTALNPTSTRKSAFADHCRMEHHGYCSHVPKVVL